MLQGAIYFGWISYNKYMKTNRWLLRGYLSHSKNGVMVMAEVKIDPQILTGFALISYYLIMRTYNTIN